MTCSRLILSTALLALVSTSSADTVTRFETTLTNEVVTTAGGAVAPELGLGGSASFTLTEPSDPSLSPTLAYELRLEGFDADLLQTPPTEDNIFAIHLHTIRDIDGSTLPYTAGTAHALNIYGVPSQRNRAELGHLFGGDDEDLVVDGPNSMISGVYEDTDVVFDSSGAVGTAPFGPQGGAGFFNGSTRSLTSMLDALRNEQLVLIVHSTNPQAQAAISSGPAIGGVLVEVPEPSAAQLGSLGLLCIGTRKRRCRKWRALLV